MRGVLAGRARETLFAHFGSTVLPPINNNATALEISKWKNLPEVAACYKKLFNEKNDFAPLAKILEKVLGKDSPTNHMAFVMALYSVMLDPNSEGIHASENSMKKKMNKYLVSFYKNLY